MALRRASTQQVPADPSKPRDFDAGYGSGVARGVSLGGGGLFFLAWQVAYLQTLANHGIRLDRADRVVGTSAGSVVASALTGGRLKRLSSQVSLLSRVPTLVAAMAPASGLSPSQNRALEAFIAATDAEPEVVRTIGHAALAAVTPRPEVTRRNFALIVGTGAWPSDALQISCVDAYTGERCVITRSTRTSLARAAAASSAVPGIFAPQPIADRRCMDGGVSGTGVHLDLLAGASRVLVLSLTDGAEMTDPMMTLHPGEGKKELDDLRASGSEVVLRVPEKVDLLTLMEPASVPGALAMGIRQAKQDLAMLSTFWG